MDLLIVAAGLGTRVSNLTFNKIPKFLISIDQFYGLFYILNYWKNYSDNIIIILHPSYIPITEYYIKSFHQNLNIQIIPYLDSDGTAFTIQHVLKNNINSFKYDKLLITWCDVYPDIHENLDISCIHNNHDICIYTYGNECRYKFDLEESRIINVGSTGGDIIGIYSFSNHNLLLNIEMEKNIDIVDYLNQLGSIRSFELKKINDFGDENKISNLRSSSQSNFHQRHFNQIVIKNGYLFKKAINDQGKSIMERESNWYNTIKNNRYNNDFEIPIPQIYSANRNSIVMEYLDTYKTVYKRLENTEMGEKEMIINRVLSEIGYFHNITIKRVDKDTFYKDIEIEIDTKIRDRVEDIKEIIDSIGEIKIVNNIQIDTLDNILNKVKNIITTYYDTNNKYKYHYIHGDLNFSNIMINNENKIKFIDPRGYFGKSLVYGLKEYDYAKILYAIYGYDSFQQSNFFQPVSLDSNEKSIHFIIPNLYLSDTFKNTHFKKIHYSFLVIIWLGLAQYIKNNYWKSICAYYYGLYLGTLL